MKRHKFRLGSSKIDHLLVEKALNFRLSPLNSKYGKFALNKQYENDMELLMDLMEEEIEFMAKSFCIALWVISVAFPE